MLTPEILNEGLTAMATGMGTVFLFLIILWFAVFIMGKIVMFLNKIFPEKLETASTQVKKTGNEVEVAIAIAAAKLRR